MSVDTEWELPRLSLHFVAMMNAWKLLLLGKANLHPLLLLHLIIHTRTDKYLFVIGGKWDAGAFRTDIRLMIPII